MTNRVKLIATDLDGTLLHSDGTLTPRSLEALAAAEAAGLVVVFVSGRPPRWLHEVADATGHIGVAVSANGAVLYDMGRDETIRAHYLEPEELDALTRTLRAEFPAVTFAVEYGDGFGAEPEYVHEWAINPRLDRRGQPIPPPLVAPLADVIAQRGVKLLAKDRAADVDEFLASADALLEGRATVTHSSNHGLLEIAAPGVTKGTGLAELAEMHGVTADEVVAVGDMPNDLPMLEWAGRSYAVANAHTAVRDAADEVLATNDEDAVAQLIESVLRAI